MKNEDITMGENKEQDNLLKRGDEKIVYLSKKNKKDMDALVTNGGGTIKGKITVLSRAKCKNDEKE